MFDKDLFGEEVKPDPQGSILAETWEYPPFSVLNAREGWWQERKRQWLALGIKSELGRGGGADGILGPDGRHRPLSAAFDTRGGLSTWQKDKR